MNTPGMPTHLLQVFILRACFCGRTVGKNNNQEEGVRNTYTILLFFKNGVHRGRKGKKRGKRTAYGGTRTNMILPVGVSENGLVGSVSVTVSFSGSLLPRLTWREARSSAMCTSSTRTVSVAGLSIIVIFVFSGLAWFG